STTVVACARGDSKATNVAPIGTVAPAATAPIPSPTFDNPFADTRQKIEASPVLTGATGWLVYRRDNELFIADLATGSEQPLTHGSLGAGYAGEAVVGGTTWLYYFSILDASNGTPAMAVMLRRPLGGDTDERLFMFRPSPYLRYADDVATVSRDGTRVAYTSDDGLHLRTLASGVDRLLLQNMPRPADRSRAGSHYSRPIWSPAGRWLLVERESDPPANAPNEGPVLLDPSVPGSERDLPIRGTPVWSPDGQQLCGNTRATESDVALYTVANGEVRDVTSSWSATARLAHSFGFCAWSPSGILTSGDNFQTIQLELAVFDTSGTKIAVLNAGAVLPGSGVPTLWLPDSSGVLVTTLNPSASVSLGLESSVVMLDGSWRRLQMGPAYV
ncbi:MAG: hypothetical protein ACREMU_12295, partial [Gemmatimonadaceae bacterium]